MNDRIREAGKKLLCGDFSQYTPTGASYFKRMGRTAKLPIKGDIQYNYSVSLGRIAHVAYVVGCSIDYANRTFTTHTIEGNTSAKSWERNGGMVARKTYENIPFDSVGAHLGDSIELFASPLYRDDTCSVSDFIRALEGELGYIEKQTHALEGDYTRAATEQEKVQNKGLNNYTKYGIWYGMNGVAWCQQFISWCAWYACKLHYEDNQNWVKEGNDWYYYDAGVPVKNSWKYIQGRWYVFDGSGKMIRGWFKDSTGWYYLAPDGGMLSSQWLFDKNAYYYLTSTGLMATNAFIKEGDKYSYVNSDGVWDETFIGNLPGPGCEVVT